MRVVQRSGSRARRPCAAAGVTITWWSVNGVGEYSCHGRNGTVSAPAKALGKGRRAREFVGLDLAAEATGQARRGARVLRSPTR